MAFRECIAQNDCILIEGALGERLKREYGLTYRKIVGLKCMLVG